MNECPRAWSRPPDDPADRSAYRVSLLLASAVLAAGIVGCAKTQEPEYPNTNLGGWVTVDKAPIDGAMISFCSQDVTNGQVIVTNIVRGRYIAEKVPLGRVLTVISGLKDTGEQTRPGGPQKIVNLVPEKYRAGFELFVNENSSRVDFPMTTH
jgi:hypothetical protein